MAATKLEWEQGERIKELEMALQHLLDAKEMKRTSGRTSRYAAVKTAAWAYANKVMQGVTANKN